MILRQAQHTAYSLQLTKLPYLPDAHVGIADDVGGISEAVILNFSCGLNALADGLACFAEFITAEFFVIYTRDFDVDVNAVEQWTGDAFLIFGNYSRRTRAGFQ